MKGLVVRATYKSLLTNYPKDIMSTVKAKPATIYAPIAQESLALVLPAFPTYITSPGER